MYIAPNIAHDKAISKPSMKYTNSPDKIKENPAIKCNFSMDNIGVFFMN